MSITAKQRADVAESNFGEPPDKFPIRNQSDLESAAHLIGKAGDPEAVKRRIIAIARRNGLKLPEAWDSNDVGMADGMVETDARIFRFGQFPAKGWAVTRDEFVAANGESGTIPVGFDPINLKHYEGKTSALDGMTGSATFAVKGEEVHARVSLPAWMEEVRKKLGLKISSVIGRLGKEIRKIDLVDTPHIKDAVFFEDDETVVVFEGEQPTIEFDDDHKDMAQMHHELAASCMPGLCSKKRDHTVKFAKETEAERGLRMIHDHSIHEGGAYCSGMDHHHHGEVGMTDDEIQELQDENVRLTAELAKTKNVTLADEETPREKALRERLEQAEAREIKKDAVTFADSVTKGATRKAYPAERKSIIEGYERAATIDAKFGETVTFSDDKGAAKQGSHVDAFKSSFALRPVIVTKLDDTVDFARDLDPEPNSEDAKAEEAKREKFREENRRYALAHNSNGAAK